MFSLSPSAPRAEHVDMQNPRIQEAFKAGRFVTKKVGTNVNPAYLMTKRGPPHRTLAHGSSGEQPRKLGKRSRAPRLEQRQNAGGSEGVAEAVGRPSKAPAPRQAMSKPLRVGKEGRRRTVGSGLNPRGPRTAGRTGTASFRPGQRYAEENWQTCRVATPPVRVSRGPRLDAWRGAPPAQPVFFGWRRRGLERRHRRGS